MHISEISKQINDNAKAHGFWEENPNIAEKLMLVVSELSEALEADRKNYFASVKKYQHACGTIDHNEGKDAMFNLHIKNSFEDEIADAVIRLFDLSFHLGIDLETHIAMKHDYNTRRPFKHGKKY